MKREIALPFILRNKFSVDKQVKVGDDVAYGRLAAEY